MEMEMEIKTETGAEIPIELHNLDGRNNSALDWTWKNKNTNYGNDNQTNQTNKEIKEPRIQIQSLYCYSCHQNFESLALFQSHRHGDEDEENCCLDVDLDGMSVTCHKCGCRFQSLRLFLDHLYRKKKRKQRKILEVSHLNLDSDFDSNSNSQFNSLSFNNNKHHSENDNNSQSVDFSDSQNINAYENETDGEYDPLDLDEEEPEEINEEDGEFSTSQTNSKSKKQPKQNKNTKDDKTKGKTKRVVCPYCPKSYGWKYVLYRHIRKFHDPNFLPSVSKPKPLKNSTSVKSVKQKEIKVQSQPQSSTSSSSQIDQTDVERNVEESTTLKVENTCDVENGEENPNPNLQKSDKKKYVPKSRSICPICNKSYSYKYVLYRHIRKYHSAESKSIKMKLKSGKYSYDSEDDEDYVYDIEKHTNVKKKRKEAKVQCPECHKILSSAHSLKYHSVIHQKPNEPGGETPNLFKCPQCDKSFTLKCYLRCHIIRCHDRYLPLLCDRCPMKFENQYVLNEHMRSHTKERPFLCTQCPLTFSYRCNLNRHMHTHAVRNYKCNFEGCNQAFRMQQTLRRHQQKHTGLRPYQCKVSGCSASFMDNKPLKTHYATAHPDLTLSQIQQLHHNRSQSIIFVTTSSNSIRNQNQQQQHFTQPQQQQYQNRYQPSYVNFIPPVPIQIPAVPFSVPIFNPAHVSPHVQQQQQQSSPHLDILH